MRAAHRSFLLVEDDSALSQGLARLIGRYGVVQIASTAREARRYLEGGSSWSGFFIDLGLPDGSGMEVLALARAIHPKIPALILTGSSAPTAINEAYDLGADYVVKPVVLSRIERFVRDAVAGSPSLEGAAQSWEERYKLCQAETDILIRAAQGQTRDAIALARGASPLTVKKQAATLLGKTRDASLQGAATRLLREILEGHHDDTHRTPEGVLRSLR
jgi:DNA-binding NarL/FixJ family response regulator